MDLERDGDGLAQGLCGMAGLFGVFDEETDLLGRGRAAHGEGVGDLLEGTAGAVRDELGGGVEFGSDISLRLFVWDMREGGHAPSVGYHAQRRTRREVVQNVRAP